MSLRTTNPFTRYNNALLLNEYQASVLGSNSSEFVNQSFVDHRITGAPNSANTYVAADFLSHSFVYLITETVGEYPYPYFSEKTWKAINTGVPFLMVNTQYSLKKLQELGFKTFSDWWDEDYDLGFTVADRIESITNVLTMLSGLPESQLVAMRKDMQPSIEYNQKYLKLFVEKDLDNIIRSI